MALPSVEYTPRDPGGSVLQQIVREHFETFRAEAAHLRDGEGCGERIQGPESHKGHSVNIDRPC